VLPQRSPWNARQARRKLQSLPTEPHPGIVPFLDVGTSANRHYLVWPFAEGETLEAVVRRDGLLPPARAAMIGVQVARALQYCERHRVYHGLIKPSNVMIGPDGQPRLLDFGLGAILAGGEEDSLVDTLAESNVTCNMFDCASPESIVDPAKRSVRGDQYSLGCTLYFGLTGRYPFPEGTMFDKMSAHQSQLPPPVGELNPTVPPGFALVIERLMQKSPEARYNNSAEMIGALLPFTRASAVYAPPPAPAPPLVDPRTTAGGSWARPGATLLAAVTPMPASAPGPLPPLAPKTPVPRPRTTSTAQLLNVAPPAVPVAPDPSGGGVPLARQPAPSDRPAVRPPRLPLWRQVLGALAIWQRGGDPIACTLLAPPLVLPGEPASVQVVVHHANRSYQARALEDWRGTAPLPGRVERGMLVGLHLGLEGITVSNPLTSVLWTGQSAAALLKVPVPPTWSRGVPIQGKVTIGLNQQPVAAIDFTLQVAGAAAPAAR
jgi:serine/threonine-protein kinase